MGKVLLWKCFKYFVRYLDVVWSLYVCVCAWFVSSIVSVVSRFYCLPFWTAVNWLLPTYSMFNCYNSCSFKTFPTIFFSLSLKMIPKCLFYPQSKLVRDKSCDEQKSIGTQKPATKSNLFGLWVSEFVFFYFVCFCSLSLLHGVSFNLLVMPPIYCNRRKSVYSKYFKFVAFVWMFHFLFQSLPPLVVKFVSDYLLPTWILMHKLIPWKRFKTVFFMLNAQSLWSEWTF